MSGSVPTCYAYESRVASETASSQQWQIQKIGKKVDADVVITHVLRRGVGTAVGWRVCFCI